jgi:hypothetical protein
VGRVEIKRSVMAENMVNENEPSEIDRLGSLLENTSLSTDEILSSTIDPAFQSYVANKLQKRNTCQDS